MIAINKNTKEILTGIFCFILCGISTFLFFKSHTEYQKLFSALLVGSTLGLGISFIINLKHNKERIK